ncbi:MAG TPA: transglycosylase SLT domain-containing protein, partial [Geobacteraceae bacterium]|nr:transglycosylase SLT domain-containing protein [Geobacteraceae bacterium]
MLKKSALLLALVLPASASAADMSSLLLKEFADSGKAGRPSVKSAGYDLRLEKSLEIPLSDSVIADSNDIADTDTGFLDEVLPESDIPLTLNSKVNYFINYFQTRGHNSFARWISRSERYIPMMKEILRKEGMPEDLVYLAMIESGFTPHAISVASAVGPWQFMSGTGKRYALRIDDWIDERRDPIKSTVAAALYLKELYALFNNDWYLAAAGYNAGENKILRAISMYDTRDFWEISKGSYLKRETKDYVPKLLAAAIIAKEPARYGFADVAYLPAMDLDTVEIPSRTDLDLIARLTDVPYQTLKELNPELRRWCTPPNYTGYQIKLPKGKKELLLAEYAKIPEEQRYTERIAYNRYRAQKRDTLTSIARKFSTTPEKLAELNHLKPKAKLRGKNLLVPVQLAAAPLQKPAEVKSESATQVADNKELNKYYTVKKGDTLYSLARRFKVTTAILSAWNNLTEKVALRPG